MNFQVLTNLKLILIIWELIIILFFERNSKYKKFSNAYLQRFQ